MYTYALETLPNGLRVQTIHLPHAHAAILSCFVKVGPRYERDEQAGLSHFVEHMLFKGTASFPDSAALSAAVEDLGGEFNGFTQTEYTSFMLRIHRDHARRGVEIFSELFRSPIFREADVEMEKRIVEQELCGYGAPDAKYPLDGFLWPGLRGRGALIGTADQIRRYPRDQVVAFFDRFYHPRNMVLTIAGTFDVGAVRDAVAATFTRLADVPVDLPVMQDAPARGPCYAHDRGPGPSCGACLAYLTPSYLHPDLTALLIIDAILGLGTSSRLFRHVRERRGLTYDISTNTTLFSDRGLLSVTFGSDARHLAEGARAVLQEIADLREQGVTPEELHRILERVRCEMEYKLDEPEEMAAWFGTQLLLLPPEGLRRPEDELQRVRQVTAADLGRVLRTLFVPDRRYLVTSGPLGWWDRRRIAKLAVAE